MASTDTESRASAHPKAGIDAAEAGSTEGRFTVEARVIEVLEGFGLAHVRASDGSTFGLNSETPGVNIADLREGQLVILRIAPKFNRVLNAQLLE